MWASLHGSGEWRGRKNLWKVRGKWRCMRTYLQPWRVGEVGFGGPLEYGSEKKCCHIVGKMTPWFWWESTSPFSGNLLVNLGFENPTYFSKSVAILWAKWQHDLGMCLLWVNLGLENLYFWSIAWSWQGGFIFERCYTCWATWARTSVPIGGGLMGPEHPGATSPGQQVFSFIFMEFISYSLCLD